MLLREIVAVCCQDHTKHTNNPTLCWRNAEFFNVRLGDVYIVTGCLNSMNFGMVEHHKYLRDVLY
jgi:hypothetical protein